LNRLRRVKTLNSNFNTRKKIIQYVPHDSASQDRV
jgi:hypothetical protein